jgi:isoleucyl-tRNA synthetase
MKFKSGTRRRALEYEKDLVKKWQENKTFEKSVEQRSVDNSYVFYDGPPFITGVPHHGTLLSSIVKDAVPRYWTMKGKRVERVWGWDCHGLPAESFTEKKLEIKDRRDIGTKISLEDYITTCRDNMVQTGGMWEDTIDRIGRWVDFKGAYKTMDNEYMESVWWAFKNLYEKGKIYEGERVLMYCTRDATPLSKAEVTMDAGSYQDVTDPSVYVKFKLVGENVSLLAWTTMAWTLPANSAVAVREDVDYVEVEVEGEHLIIAEVLVDHALQDEKHHTKEYKVIRKLKGAELVGKSYEPILPVPDELKGNENAFKVWHAGFVHLDGGTGIVHQSPGTGEEDYILAKENNIPWIMSTDENGIFTMSEWKGMGMWDVNKQIAKTLHERGIVWKIDYIKHSYPHCYRCNTRLMYRAHPSWFMNIQDQKSQMLELNEDINWFPEHLKHGRFAKTVETAPDWNLSRDRFWATPMPIWKGRDSDGKELIKVVGSFDELEKLSGKRLDDYHRPWIDDVKFTIDGVEYTRIDKVMDCWFESGSMPFAQFHYPFENKEKFETSFPGDFVVEYIGQVRAWFYYMHAVSIGLFGKAPFKQVVTTGIIAGSDGRKMSKSYGNYTDPNELMDKFSADSLRFLLLSSPLLSGEDFALQDKEVGDVARKLTMIWNMYDFFTMYAEVDNWDWDGELSDPLERLANPLDIWVVSRIHQLQIDIDQNMQNYDLPNSLKPVLLFVEDASNWFVRRSRRRFWKSGDDQDKSDAYRTLHYVLARLSMILAPFVPFLAEELYQKLTGGESVHLLDWPEDGGVYLDVLNQMERTRDYVQQGLSIRAKSGIKVRQPLGKVTYYVGEGRDLPALDSVYEEILAEELNVKSVVVGTGRDLSVQVVGEGRDLPTQEQVELDLEITPDLHREGLMREVVRCVQAARKQAGLNVDDRINLALKTDNDELKQAIQEHKDTIMSETLAQEISGELADAKYTVGVEIESIKLKLSLS